MRGRPFAAGQRQRDVSVLAPVYSPVAVPELQVIFFGRRFQRDRAELAGEFLAAPGPGRKL